MPDKMPEPSPFVSEKLERSYGKNTFGSIWIWAWGTMWRGYNYEQLDPLAMPAASKLRNSA